MKKFGKIKFQVKKLNLKSIVEVKKILCEIFLNHVG